MGAGRAEGTLGRVIFTSFFFYYLYLFKQDRIHRRKAIRCDREMTRVSERESVTVREKEGLHYTRDNPGEGHDGRSEGLAKVAAG
jgi:hypothetical protein